MTGAIKKARHLKKYLFDAWKGWLLVVNSERAGIYYKFYGGVSEFYNDGSTDRLFL